MDKNTPINQLPINWNIRDALSKNFNLPENTYEHALTVTDEKLFSVFGIGPVLLNEWKYFKTRHPVAVSPDSPEGMKREIEQLRKQLDDREDRVSVLSARLCAKDKETQDLVWKNQSLTYRVGQTHKMLDMVRNGLTVPELRRIGFKVDISVPEEVAS